MSADTFIAILTNGLIFGFGIVIYITLEQILKELKKMNEREK
jgi:hypothetical protein